MPAKDPSAALKWKMDQYRVPLQSLKLDYSLSWEKKKVKEIYTDQEDRFLLVMLEKWGVENEYVHDLIREAIRESPIFRYDWFILCRSSKEIGRQCKKLLTIVAREFELCDNGNINYEDSILKYFSDLKQLFKAKTGCATTTTTATTGNTSITIVQGPKNEDTTELDDALAKIMVAICNDKGFEERRGKGGDFDKKWREVEDIFEGWNNEQKPDWGWLAESPGAWYRDGKKPVEMKGSEGV